MRALIILFFLCFLFSCGGKTRVPDDVLPVKKMTNVLWDMMLADELVSHNYPVDTANKRFDTSIVLYRQISLAHGITQKEFKRSLQFYQSRPDLLQIILDTLSKRATPAPAKEPSKMPPPDSLELAPPSPPDSTDTATAK